MKIVSEKTLKEFRSKSFCEWCEKPAGQKKLDPHHAIYKTGMGGGSRMDLSLNLLSCHRLCHHKIEDTGAEANRKCLLIISKREGETPDDVLAVLQLLWRLPKGSDPTIHMDELGPTAKALMWKTWGEVKC